MQNRTLLALDTTTQVCSVALAYAGQVSQISENLPQQHTQLIVPMIDDLLNTVGITLKQVEAFAFGVGPGSFTGLRIASSVVQALALATDKPVIPVSSLQTLAQAAWSECQVSKVLAVLDARMQEFYWGCFEKNSDNLMQCIGNEQLTKAEMIHVPDQDVWLGIGSGFEKIPSIANVKPILAERSPEARAMLPIAEYAFNQGHYMAPEMAQPNYLRQNIVHISSL